MNSYINYDWTSSCRSSLGVLRNTKMCIYIYMCIHIPVPRPKKAWKRKSNFEFGANFFSYGFETGAYCLQPLVPPYLSVSTYQTVELLPELRNELRGSCKGLSDLSTLGISLFHNSSSLDHPLLRSAQTCRI